MGEFGVFEGVRLGLLARAVCCSSRAPLSVVPFEEGAATARGEGRAQNNGKRTEVPMPVGTGICTGAAFPSPMHIPHAYGPGDGGGVCKGLQRRMRGPCAAQATASRRLNTTQMAGDNDDGKLGRYSYTGRFFGRWLVGRARACTRTLLLLLGVYAGYCSRHELAD